VSSGSAAALAGVKNPDGSTRNLIMDVHKYLDSDNSGTHTDCVKDNISNAFQPLATWLRSNKRQAILSETGGGNTASCQQYLCNQLRYLNQNSDVYIGYTGWAAGGFASSYELNETPTQNGNSWTDTSLVKSCIVGVWKGA
jgi:endoglucanase